jgi:hypothetical protein
MAAGKTRLASLSVLGGSLHGRRLDIEEVVSEILIGSDPDCHLTLDLPTISPIHAKLWTDLDGATVHDTHAPRGLYINLDRIQGQGHLGEGDVLWLGPPQEPGSVCVQCHFEPWVEVLPAAPAPVASVAPPAEPESAIEAPPASAAALVGEAQDPFFVGGGEDSPAGPTPASQPAAGSDADVFFIEDAGSRRDERGSLTAEPAGGAQADDFFVAEVLAHPPTIDLPPLESPSRPLAAVVPAAAPERVTPAPPARPPAPANVAPPAAAAPTSTP